MMHRGSQCRNGGSSSPWAVLLANQLLAFATQQLDIWLAGGLLTPQDLGLYGAAKRSVLVAAMPVQMAMLTIVSAIPRLHVQDRKAELQRVVRGPRQPRRFPRSSRRVADSLPAPILRLVLGASYSAASVGYW